MQTLFTDGTRKYRSLLGGGFAMAARNKRYIFWFWFLNLTLAEFGTAAFRRSAHAILDHSLYAGDLLPRFDLGVFAEFLFRPESGPMNAMLLPAGYFAFLFFALTALFLPGVFQGYASNYGLPRDKFFRACGQNLWRFIRLLIVAGIVMTIVAAVLFGIQRKLVDKAGESTLELLPFIVRMAGLAIIFLVMTALRIWFDLAEADVVLSDQNAVRRSIGAGFRHMFRSLGRLLPDYVLIAIVAAIVLVGGLWAWMTFIRPDNIWGAFLVAQVTLLLLLVPRFWQRGVAVAYWQEKMAAPPVAVAAAIPSTTDAGMPASELQAVAPASTLPSAMPET
jgi:hypothetical protein